MSSLLQLFRPYDLQPIYEAWTDAPIFDGQKPSVKKGRLGVDAWLDAIQEGCLSRKVPKTLWHDVAQHFMGQHASARLAEVQKVLLQLHGGKFSWNWEKFRTAMHTLRWDIDTKDKIVVRWGRKVMTDLWSKVKKKDESEVSVQTAAPPVRPAATNTRAKTEPFITRTPKKSSASKLHVDSAVKGTGKSVDDSVVPSKSRFSFSMGTFAERKKCVDDNTPTASHVLKKAAHTKAASTSLADAKVRSQSMDDSIRTLSRKYIDIPRLDEDPDAMHRLAEVPLWLLQTCVSLENLTSEYPRTMSVVGAILITIGSIPAIPAVSAGAAGAFLASATAHALGGVALGLGSLITAQTVENSVAATSEENGRSGRN